MTAQTGTLVGVASSFFSQMPRNAAPVKSGQFATLQIVNVTPPPSFTILPSTFIQFDVVDSLGASNIELIVPVIVVDATKAGERAYDWNTVAPAPGGSAPGTAANAGPGVFDAAYAAPSTVIAIANGYRFRIRRLNGWATPPALRVFAINAQGTVALL